MPILDYSYDDPIGYEGQLYGANDILIDSGLNVTGLSSLSSTQLQQLRSGEYEPVYLSLQSSGSWLVYGRGVQAAYLGSSPDPSQDPSYVLASATTRPIVGVAVLMHQYERVGPRELNGVPPLKQFGVLKRGDVVVYSETPARKFDPVFCRVGTGNNPRGRWRNGAVEDETLPVPGAYYLQSITQPGLVVIRFNFVATN